MPAAMPAAATSRLLERISADHCPSSRTSSTETLPASQAGQGASRLGQTAGASRGALGRPVVRRIDRRGSHAHVSFHTSLPLHDLQLTVFSRGRSQSSHCRPRSTRSSRRSASSRRRSRRCRHQTAADFLSRPEKARRAPCNRIGRLALYHKHLMRQVPCARLLKAAAAPQRSGSTCCCRCRQSALQLSWRLPSERGSPTQAGFAGGEARGKW